MTVNRPGSLPRDKKGGLIGTYKEETVRFPKGCAQCAAFFFRSSIPKRFPAHYYFESAAMSKMAYCQSPSSTSLVNSYDVADNKGECVGLFVQRIRHGPTGTVQETSAENRVPRTNPGTRYPYIVLPVCGDCLWKPLGTPPNRTGCLHFVLTALRPVQLQRGLPIEFSRACARLHVSSNSSMDRKLE